MENIFKPKREIYGSGKFRNVYEIENGKLAKKPKEYFNKRYFFGKIKFRNDLYSLVKLGNKNPNVIEYKNYTLLPEHIREKYVPKMRLIKGILVVDKVVDFDGKDSEAVNQVAEKSGGKITNAFFWQELGRMKDELIKANCLLFIVFNEHNIMARRSEDGNFMPIIVDLKRLNNFNLPFQPQLYLQKYRANKFLRKYERFVKKYRPE